MTDFYYELSWKAAIKAYSLKQFGKDSIIPLVLTIAILVLSFAQKKLPLASIIVKVCDMMIVLLPVFISILIAAFAIWISFFLSNAIDFIKESEDGSGLLNELNASFLIEISFSIIGMLFTIFVLLIAGMDFSIDGIHATIVNTIVLSMLLFVCFAVIWWLIYIAKNLHNIAKFTILYERIESKNK